MNKGQRLYKFILGLLMPFLFLACSSKERIKIDGGTFNVDGKDVQLICGEMHYARIPHEYWRDRLKRARAMGLNTISVYVFWNFHERQPGEFDFSGQGCCRICTSGTGGRLVCDSPSGSVCLC